MFEAVGLYELVLSLGTFLFGVYYVRSRFQARTEKARLKALQEEKEKEQKIKEDAGRIYNLDNELKEIEDELADKLDPSERLFKDGVQPQTPDLKLIYGNKVEIHEEDVKPKEKYVSLEEALKPTRSGIMGRIRSLFQSNVKVSSADLEGIEEVLYTSDLGPQTVQRLLSAIQKKIEVSETKDVETVRGALKDEMLTILEQPKHKTQPLERFFESTKQVVPSVWMVVGVNGAGKTTTIGKLAHRLATSGKKVLIAAGDTFRAAAGEQLKVWSERAQVEIFSPEGVDNPSGVAFEAVKVAKSQGYDVVIIDTAGRLHTQKNLMEELRKIKRVIGKAFDETKLDVAPHEILLVLDANSGQNALIQAREFHQSLGVTGVVLTKLDGTAKGGVAIGIASELGLPIQLIGVGEGKEDLRPFDPKGFVDAII